MIFKPISVDPVISEGTKKKQWWKHWSLTRVGDRQVAGGLFICQATKKGCHKRRTLESLSPSTRYAAGRYVEGAYETL